MINKTHDFYKMINLLINMEGCNFCIERKREKPALLTRTCPPGLALAGPDMTEVRVLVKFCTFRIKKWLFEEISKCFCMVLRGEGQKTRFWDQKPKIWPTMPNIPAKSQNIHKHRSFYRPWCCLINSLNERIRKLYAKICVLVEFCMFWFQNLLFEVIS